MSFNSNDEHDAMDGELVCRVLQLMNLTDGRLSQVRLKTSLLFALFELLLLDTIERSGQGRECFMM